MSHIIVFIIFIGKKTLYIKINKTILYLLFKIKNHNFMIKNIITMIINC